MQLKDINDVYPEFVSSKEASVLENAATNTIVTVIKAIDTDEGRNAQIEYVLTDEHLVPFSLGPVDGLLRVSGRIDRESRSSYTLQIKARDRGEPPLSTNTELTVKILDENDNSPVLDSRHYSASVAENASIGALVLQVFSLFSCTVTIAELIPLQNSRCQLLTSMRDQTVEFAF